MDHFDPRMSFGPDVARRYDDESRGDEDAAADYLAGHARGGRALEFAIGTGRIALPLVARGTPVDGIEMSPDMVARLRDKPGGDELDVVIGDMASGTTGRTYPLVYLVYNTLYNILTQQGQIDCFVNAARHLDDDGVFVIEAAPPWVWIRGDQFVNVERIETDSVLLDVNRYNPVTQILDENHLRIGTDGIQSGPISCRLVWPSEMDLMAQIAGLRLVERSGDWSGGPFLPSSPFHVSVYARS